MTHSDKATLIKYAIARWRSPENLLNVIKRIDGDRDGNISGKLLSMKSPVSGFFNTINRQIKDGYPHESGNIKNMVSGVLQHGTPDSFFTSKPVPDFAAKLPNARLTTFHNREFADGQGGGSPDTLWRISKNVDDSKKFPKVFGGNRFTVAEPYARNFSNMSTYGGEKDTPTTFGFLNKFTAKQPIAWRDYNANSTSLQLPIVPFDRKKILDASVDTGQLSTDRKYMVPDVERHGRLINKPIVDVSNVDINSLSKAVESYRQPLLSHKF